jgi:hypothetical protein
MSFLPGAPSSGTGDRGRPLESASLQRRGQIPPHELASGNENATMPPADDCESDIVALMTTLRDYVTCAASAVFGFGTCAAAAATIAR